MQNLTLLVSLPRANQQAQFALFTKTYHVHTITDKNTTNGFDPQVLFSLNPQILMFFIFQYLYLFKKLLKKYPLTPNLYILIDTSAKKNCVFQW